MRLSSSNFDDVIRFKLTCTVKMFSETGNKAEKTMKNFGV